ncbi:hypothetical protein [Mesorhizobium calcicola]
MQVIDGEPVVVEIRKGGSADGVPEKQCGPSGGDDRVAFHQPERPPPQT